MEISDKVKDFFRANIGYFAVGLVSVIYVATAFITIGKTGKSVNEIIADGTIALLLGVLINRIFDVQGMLDGDRDERVIATMKQHNETVMRISDSMDKLDDWCAMKNAENLKFQRIKILATCGMKYSDYFDETGGALCNDRDYAKVKSRALRKLNKKRIRCFNKALKLKLTQLTAGTLTSEGGRVDDAYNFGRTKQQYEAQATWKDLLTKILTALLFGYYGVELISNFSYGDLIWKFFQVGLFVLFGVYKMNATYMFITDEYRGRIVKKTDNLMMFENYVHKKEEKPNDVGGESKASAI